MFSGEGDACLWNANFTTKPAYTSVISLLGGSVSSTTMASSSTSTSTSAKTTTTSSSSGGTSAEWGQCGGIGWTGPTACVSGTSCVYQNAYYSQVCSAFELVRCESC